MSSQCPWGWEFLIFWYSFPYDIARAGLIGEAHFLLYLVTVSSPTMENILLNVP
ncbi:hypothetical protein D082_50720 (plasmid) [Synechocystis sp. PCC 6714]|nr:hypothetical protein D082_50720 [Synechocystis sp. PCC 6714]